MAPADCRSTVYMRDHEVSLAHVTEDGRMHALSDHLHGTSEIAARFAAEFGAAGWGRLAGLWHDLGKYDRRIT